MTVQKRTLYPSDIIRLWQTVYGDSTLCDWTCPFASQKLLYVCMCHCQFIWDVTIFEYTHSDTHSCTRLATAVIRFFYTSLH